MAEEHTPDVVEQHCTRIAPSYLVVASPFTRGVTSFIAPPPPRDTDDDDTVDTAVIPW